VEPLLQWAKVETVVQDRQVVPCLAGKISGVVYANGDVGVCEIHQPIGNLRTKTFPEIWWSDEAKALRESIRRKECHCTTEVFLWSSITYQPVQLARAVAAARPWRKPLPLLSPEPAAAPEPAPSPEPAPADIAAE
jgi:hypothetical protein